MESDSENGVQRVMMRCGVSRVSAGDLLRIVGPDRADGPEAPPSPAQKRELQCPSQNRGHARQQLPISLLAAAAVDASR